MKKKRIWPILITLLVWQHGLAQTTNKSNKFTINGILTGIPIDSVLIYYEGAAGKYIHEAMPVVNNKFTISGEISQPCSGRILFKNTGDVISRLQREGRMREFYIEPVILTLKGNPHDLKSMELTGSKTETEYEELESKVEPIREEMKPLEAAYSKEKDQEKAAAIHDQFGPYNVRIKKVTYQFFNDHPNSFVTLDMMTYYVSRVSLDSSKLVYNAFNDELKATVGAKEILTNIQQIEAGMPGAMAPNFTKTDIKGKQISLADFRGKYVMLDFWASWCVPCRKSNPQMIEIYNKYKNKGLDIIGIADDDENKTVWNNTVAKDGVGIWHNVLRGLKMDMIMKHIPNPEDLDQQYGVASIPTKILIGPDGKILGRYGDTYGGTEVDMDKMLASIFDK